MRRDLELGEAPSPVEVLLATWRDGTREWRENLGRVNPAAINWQPYADAPSIGGLLLHMADVDRWWIEEVALGLPYEPSPAGEYGSRLNQDVHHWPTPPAKPLSWFLAELETSRQRVFAHVEQLDLNHWVPRGRTREFRLRWIVAHLVQHDSYHGGQAVLLHEMWKRRSRLD